VRIAHVAMTGVHTSMEDARCWFPLRRLRAAAAAGRIGALAERFSRRADQSQSARTLDIDCPEILRRCREDGADAAILLATSRLPSSLSLAARHLESHGISDGAHGCA